MRLLRVPSGCLPSPGSCRSRPCTRRGGRPPAGLPSRLVEGADLRLLNPKSAWAPSGQARARGEQGKRIVAEEDIGAPACPRRSLLRTPTVGAVARVSCRSLGVRLRCGLGGGPCPGGGSALALRAALSGAPSSLTLPAPLGREEGDRAVRHDRRRLAGFALHSGSWVPLSEDDAAADAGVVEVELFVFVAQASCSRVMKKTSSPSALELRKNESLGLLPLEIRGTQPPTRLQPPTPFGSH